MPSEHAAGDGADCGPTANGELIYCATN